MVDHLLSICSAPFLTGGSPPVIRLLSMQITGGDSTCSACFCWKFAGSPFSVESGDFAANAAGKQQKLVAYHAKLAAGSLRA